MKNALLYKEWKKTRFFAIGILLSGIALMLYMFLSVGRSFRFAGMEHLWDVIVNRKQFLFRELKYYPLAAGICMAVFQYVPEMIQNRIKLTLHLPIKENSAVKLMLMYGLGILFVIYTLQCIALWFFSAYFFPHEFVASIFKTVAPWYGVGIMVYLFIAAICIEPTWKRRIVYAILCFGTAKLFILSDLPAAMTPMFGFLLLIVLITFPLSLLSVQRYKQGNID